MLRQALDYLSRTLGSKHESYHSRQLKKRPQLNIEQLELRWLPAVFTLSSSTYSVTETIRYIDIEVDKAGLAGTVDYSVASGTATVGSDLTSVSGTLSFSKTELSKLVRVPITDDGISDNAETFTFTLSNPTGGTLGTPSSATVTINDGSSSWTFSGQQRVVDALQGARYPFGDASIGLQTGDYSISQTFDYGQGAAVFAQPTLVYHSDTTTVRPIVEATITIPTGDSNPSSSEARFSWNGGSPGSWTSFTSPASGDNRWVYGFQASSAVSTGLYNWSIDVREHFTSLGDVTRTYTGTALVVANSGAFGEGWSIDGFNQLVAVSGGMMMVYGGGGSARLFTGSGGT